MTVTSGMGQYLEDAVLATLRGTAFPTVPTHFFLAAFTTAPINGTDAAAVEVSGTNYGRVQITPNTSNFAAPSGAAPATIASGADFSFATPGASWGTVVGWGLYDALTAGNLWFYGPVSPGVAVGSGDSPVKFASASLTLTAS